MCLTTVCYTISIHIVVHLYSKIFSLRDYHVRTADQGRTFAIVVLEEVGNLLPDHHYLRPQQAFSSVWMSMIYKRLFITVVDTKSWRKRCRSKGFDDICMRHCEFFRCICMCRNSTDLGTKEVNLMNGSNVIWIIRDSCEFLSSEKVHVWDSHGIANTFYCSGRRKSGYERWTKVCHPERCFTYSLVWDSSFQMCSQRATTPNHEILRQYKRSFRVIKFYFGAGIALSDFRFQLPYIHRTRCVCGWGWISLW
jgi:hypothetical protein